VLDYYAWRHFLPFSVCVLSPKFEIYEAEMFDKRIDPMLCDTVEPRALLPVFFLTNKARNTVLYFWLLKFREAIPYKFGSKIACSAKLAPAFICSTTSLEQ